MDRRRYVPCSEDLEGRRLLSAAKGGKALVSAAATSNLNQRIQRIERLPAFLRSTQPGRALPEEVTEAIQERLYALVGTMKKAPSNGLAAFNSRLRGLLEHPTVSVAQANEMSSLFGKILTKAGADPFTAEGLQGSMNQLVRVNASNARNSGFLTANDYSLVLQVALAVGRPLPAPRLPRLAPGDDSPPRGDWRTKETQPTLLGTYSRQSTMQIVSESGDTVFGSAATAADGSYAVRFTNALAPGSYVFRMRALALQGGISRLGKAFRLTILAPTPKGPRALG